MFTLPRLSKKVGLLRLVEAVLGGKRLCSRKLIRVAGVILLLLTNESVKTICFPYCLAATTEMKQGVRFLNDWAQTTIISKWVIRWSKKKASIAKSTSRDHLTMISGYLIIPITTAAGYFCVTECNGLDWYNAPIKPDSYRYID